MTKEEKEWSPRGISPEEWEDRKRLRREAEERGAEERGRKIRTARIMRAVGLIVSVVIFFSTTPVMLQGLDARVNLIGGLAFFAFIFFVWFWPADDEIK